MEEVVVSSTTANEPMVHQIAKLVLGVLAGFAASKLVHREYDHAVSSWRNTHTTTTE